MTLTRWIPSFLAFPLGGWLAIALIGSMERPIAAAAGGLLTGAVLGAAQWLALQPTHVGRRWIVATAAAMSAGSALAAAVTGGGTEVADLMLFGLIAGTTVGAAQAALLGRPEWVAVTGASWALGWLATASIGVDVERGYIVFGASGAILVTLLTGLALIRPAVTR
jgi:Fe2+ transport system protein FeoA